MEDLKVTDKGVRNLEKEKLRLETKIDLKFYKEDKIDYTVIKSRVVTDKWEGNYINNKYIRITRRPERSE